MKLARLTTILLAFVIVTAFGCGDAPRNDSDPEPVDHQTTQGAVEKNAQGAVDDSLDVMAHLREDEQAGMLMQEFESPSEPACVSGDGEPTGDDDSTESGDDGDSTGCDDGEPAEADPEAESEAAVDFLNEHIFIEDHIEQESEHEITYLLDGDNVCVEEDFADAEAHQECVDHVDELEIRLQVTSPSADDLDIAVLIGPAEHHPVDIQLHTDLVAAEVELADLHAAAEFAAEVVDESTEALPESMQGRVRAELGHRSDQAELEFSVLSDIDVRDGEKTRVRIDRSSPTAYFAADAASDELEAKLDLASVDAEFPVSYGESEWDPETGEENVTEYEYQVDAFLAGATSEMQHTLGDEELEIENIGLGQEASTVDIEGQRAFEVDLNGTSGRTFDATLIPGDEGLEARVDPAFDLQMMFALQGLEDDIGEVEDWMLDELLRITLDGAPEPGVFAGESGLEVLDGQLVFDSKNEETVTVDAGECLTDGSYDEGGDTVDGDDSGSGSEDTSYHPFASLGVESCQ